MLYNLVIVFFAGSGVSDTFIIDSSLTREDCAYIISEGIESIDTGKQTIKLNEETTIFVCEPMNPGFKF